MKYLQPLEKLIEQFRRLPSIGPKTAVRLAYYMLKIDNRQAQLFVHAIQDAREKIHYCSKCFNYTDNDPCEICSDSERDNQVICVVEHPQDVVAMERTRTYRGLYHVLHGAMSPLDGIGPEDLKIKELLVRITPDINELVIATNSNVEGEATALYLSRLIKPMGVRVTRIAHGIPVGGDLEYADEVTLSKALENRREM